MLQPWQLIKLKQEYGGIYVVTYNNSLYVSRQPTLLEITQQQDAKRVFDLTTEQMFLELVKACLVYPEDPEQVPQPQIQMLAESMLDDVPLTEAELENKIYEMATNDDKSLFTDVALELWSQVQGTTIHEFFKRPIKEVLQMYSAVKLVQQIMEQQGDYYQQEASQQPSIEFEYNNQPIQQSQSPSSVGGMDINSVKKILGKSLDEQLKELKG